MKYIFVTHFLFLFILVSAQKKRKTCEPVLKIYNLSSYQTSSSSWPVSNGTMRRSSSDFQIFKPTVAINWRANDRHRQEIELVDLNINKKNEMESLTSFNQLNVPISGADVVKSSLSIRYEFIINLIKISFRHFSPSIGFAANPYINQYKSMPHTTSSFPVSEVNYGCKGFVIPRIIYRYSSKIFFDLNIPITLMDGNLSFDTVRNPSIPNNQQRTSTVDLKIFPSQFSLRIGAGFRLF